jgi:hypothetical protein
MHHRALALLLAAAPLALADPHCGTIEPNSQSANYATAVRAHSVATATTLECPPNYYLGPRFSQWCCPNGDSINELASKAVACCPCGADCGDYFPSAVDFSTMNGKWWPERITQKLIQTGGIEFVPMTSDGSAKSAVPTTLVTSASPDAGKHSLTDRTPASKRPTDGCNHSPDPVARRVRRGPRASLRDRRLRRRPRRPARGLPRRLRGGIHLSSASGLPLGGGFSVPGQGCVPVCRGIRVGHSRGRRALGVVLGRADHHAAHAQGAGRDGVVGGQGREARARPRSLQPAPALRRGPLTGCVERAG